MLSWTLTLRVTTGLLLAALTLPALGEEDERPRGRFSSLINVDALIDNHARFLARKYDLTEEQDLYTQQFLRARADEFFSHRRDDLFELADQLFEVKAGGDMDQEGLIAWGKRALPLYEEAKLLIVNGNVEWREILTEDQCLIHDEDLRQMYESFETTENQLHRIVTGQMSVDEFRRGPRPKRRSQSTAQRHPRPHPPVIDEAKGIVAEPARVTSEPERLSSRNTPTSRRRLEDLRGRLGSREGGTQSARDESSRSAERHKRAGKTAGAGGGEDFESKWEKYVREFIERYQLTEAQAQRAQAVLKDCQEQARNQMHRRKPQLDRLEQKSKSLTTTKDKAKALAQIVEQRRKLLEPINRIFERQLKPRLEKLPTRAQRKAAEASGKGGKLESSRKKPARTPPRPRTPSKPNPEPSRSDTPADE